MKYQYIILMIMISNSAIPAIAEDNHNVYKSLVDDMHGFYKIYNLKSNSIEQLYQNRTLNIYKGDTVKWINDQYSDKRLTIISEQKLWNNNTGIIGWNYKEFKYTFNETGIYIIYLKEKPKKTQKIIVGPININDSNLININKDNIDFVFKSQSPDVGVHQGISTDKKNYYVFDTNSIKKYDPDWNLIAENDNINKESGYPHSVDGQYYNGKLYIAAGYIPGAGSSGGSGITVWDASNLSFDSKHNISAQKINPAGLSIDNGIIYVIGDAYNIVKYDLNFKYLGTLSIKPHLPPYPQGITKKGDYFYITDSGNGAIYRIYKNGKNLGIVWNTTGYLEGIDYSTETLLYLTDLDTSSKKNKYIVELTENMSNSVISSERINDSTINSVSVTNSTTTNSVLTSSINPSDLLIFIAATSISIYIMRIKKEIKK